MAELHRKKLEAAFAKAPSEQKRYIEFCATELLARVLKHGQACGLPYDQALLVARQVSSNAASVMGTFLRLHAEKVARGAS